MTINRLLFWCEECQAYTYNDEDDHCAICDSEREYGPEYLFKNGKVTRIDFAVDISSEQVEEYFYHYPKMQYVERVQSKSGCTEYIGAKAKTGKRVIVYDRLPAIKAYNNKKYKEKQKMPVPDKHIMRVEIKLFPDISFKMPQRKLVLPLTN
jgi:sarcosine oxidase delta subunit